jgi:hypothetical protein
MTISMDKKYRTRDGREVRIYAVDGGYGKHPIHGAVNSDYGWIVQMWSDIGACASGSPYDLIEVKPRIQREYWMNIYDGAESTALWNSKQRADAQAENNDHRRIACVKIVIDYAEEGEGL